MWARYQTHDFLKYFGKGPYGSAFISRPDSAPWIDTESYWASVRKLWEGRDIIFVAGSDRSLRDEDFASAYSVRKVEATRRDAYAEIDRIEEEIGLFSGPVILCLGPTATVLSARLAKKGVHALDLGHVGQFMRHQGAYRFSLDDLASPEYRAQLKAMHARKSWGLDSWKHGKDVNAFAAQLGVISVLDYGCGGEALKKALAESGLKIEGFDPGIPGKDILPKPADLVVATDILEHVEGKKLDNVLKHISLLAGKGVYLVIATRPANARLPDGSNAHKIVKDADFWLQKVGALDLSVCKSEIRGKHEVAIGLRK
jgi:hypothetical protein